MRHCNYFLACDEFESMDDIATGEAEADQSDDEFRDMEPSMADSLLDSHEPPSELGLAGLEEEEEDEDEFDETERKKHAISPVTWDVDVHAADENISVCILFQASIFIQLKY